VPLTPIGLIAFTCIFVASVVLTQRRPAYGLAALIAVLPFALYAQAGGTTVTLPKVLLLGVAAGLLTRIRDLSTLRTVRPMLIAFAAMIVAIALTMIPSMHHAATLRELFKWIEYALLFATVAAARALDPDDALLRTAWMISIAIVCASALVQEITAPPETLILRGAPVPRISGVLEGPNQCAGYLEIAVAVLLAWGIARPSRIVRVLLAVVVCSLVLTFSRAGIACGALAALLVAYLNRARIADLLPVFAGAACGCAGIAAWWIAAPHLWHHRLFTWDTAGGVGHRGELWRAALAFFRVHPLLGIGAGNFELALPQAGVYGVRTHANSWYLQAVAEGGVILFVATLAWIGTALRGLARELHGSPWRIAAFSVTVALVVHQAADYLVFYPKVAEPWIALIALAMV
jgi:O-antigen ligase